MHPAVTQGEEKPIDLSLEGRVPAHADPAGLGSDVAQSRCHRDVWYLGGVLQGAEVELTPGQVLQAGGVAGAEGALRRAGLAAQWSCTAEACQVAEPPRG